MGAVRRVVVAAVASVLASSPALAGVSEALDYLAQQRIARPTPAGLTVCHDFGCAARTEVGLAATDLRDMRRLFAKVRTAREERDSIARAVALIETRVGPVTGTAGDRGGLDPLTPEQGQLDCIDETNNTTQYLVLLWNLGLLLHHEPAFPASRGFFLDLRYPHQTATIVETASGRVWAIDSWPHPNGARPDVMPLDAWKAARPR